jgi:hypothetical protein
VTRGTYSKQWIIEVGPGLYTVQEETNDNDDDGYPDAVGVETWALEPMRLETALTITHGASHRGLYGQPCDVWFNGTKLTDQNLTQVTGMMRRNSQWVRA